MTVMRMREKRKKNVNSGNPEWKEQRRIKNNSGS